MSDAQNMWRLLWGTYRAKCQVVELRHVRGESMARMMARALEIASSPRMDPLEMPTRERYAWKRGEGLPF